MRSHRIVPAGNRVLRLAMGLALGLLVTACAGLKPLAPEVSLAGLQVNELTLSHANMLANLRVFNPNTVALDIEEVDYSLYLNGIKVSTGRSAKGLTIGAEETGELALRLSSAYWDILRVLNQAQGGKDIDFKILGKVKVGGFGILGKTFDFEREGSLPLTGVKP